jgi:hypothetical protein
MNSPFTGRSLKWRKLCRAAGFEQDPQKLYEIVHKLNAALRMRQRMLRSRRSRNHSPVLHIDSRSGRAA